jgi:XTP/dITP diphosphohydrolase
MSELLRLKEVMDKLRSPGGCPWDSEQTHQSILKYLIEESYEFIDSVEENDRIAMREELGDVLLQVYFHSRIAEEDESDPFSIEEVAAGVIEKLISRHPHVFSGAQSSSSEELLTQWEKAKQAEKGRTSPFEGVPRSQPALALAAKAFYRLEKLEHPYEIEKSDRIGDISSMTSEEFGDLILDLVHQATAQGIEPEAAVRAATIRFMEKTESELAK